VIDYPVEELLADYEKWSHPAIPVSARDMTPNQFFGLLKAFFQLQYPDDKKKAHDRCQAFRKAMALIWNSQEDLHREKLIAVRPAKYGTLFSTPILAAAHELVNLRGVEQPTIEQMKEAARKYGWKPNES
jgi:hypothetical protein